MSDPDLLARMFKVLSVGTRVRLVQTLKSRPLCVNALARQMGITPAAVSQHLRVLRDADILLPEKHGNFVHYRVNEAKLSQWWALAGNLMDVRRTSMGATP